MKNYFALLGILILTLFVLSSSSNALNPQLKERAMSGQVVSIEKLDVSQLQRYLHNIGYLDHKTGILDRETRTALNKYLIRRGLLPGDYLTTETIKEMGLNFNSKDVELYYAE